MPHTQTDPKPHKKYLILLTAMCIISFALHVSPILFIDITKFNYYDVDSWHFLHVTQHYNVGESVDSDDTLISKIGSILSYGETDIKRIFFKVGFFNPILLVISAVFIFFGVKGLFGGKAAFYSSIIWLFPADIYLNYQASYGVFDHHLLESALFIMLVICAIYIIKQKWIFIPISVTLIYLISQNSYTLLVVPIMVFISTFIIYYFFKSENKFYYILVSGIGLICGLIAIVILKPELIKLILWSDAVPIVEMQPYNPVTFICLFGILILIIVIGIKKYKLSNEILAMVILTSLCGLACFVFMRFEYFFFPLLAITSAFFIRLKLSNLFIVYLIIAISSAGAASYLIVSTSNQYYGMSDAMEVLYESPQGNVLAVWDNIYFINTTSGKTSTVVGSQYMHGDSKLLVSCNTTKKQLTEYNISYVFVSKNDIPKYDYIRGDLEGNYQCSFLNMMLSNKSELSPLYLDTTFKLYRVNDLL